jgi:L-threonylcarbamoyladenylate synthase
MLQTAQVSKIAEILIQDGICAIPTETVYGLAGNALKPEVVSRIFEIKNRPTFDPLILHVSNLESILPLVLEVSNMAERFMQTCWPGPLTILLPRNNLVPDIVCSGSDWVGFRVPNHPLTLDLLKMLPFPLAAPSANPFGYISPTQSSHVMDQLGELIDGILEGGACKVGIESTVIRVMPDRVEILRAGAITPEQLSDISGLPIRWIHSSEHPTAPGMLDLHYAPHKRLCLDTPASVDSPQTAWMRFSTLRKDIPEDRQFILAPDFDLKTAARNLFALMRQLDQSTRFTQIIAELVPSHGLGIALNDKLRKASASRGSSSGS